MAPRIEQLPRIEKRKDHVFTWSYHQPDEYHFCQDSILLAEFVAENLRAKKIDPSFRVLDLCAGCGVVGLELATLVPAIERIDFIEVQPSFEPYFAQNRETLKRSDQCFRFLNLNYERLLDLDVLKANQIPKYDLIVANPPYFHRENTHAHARAQERSIKDRCRVFLDSSYESLIEVTIASLAASGEAFVLVKDGATHGSDVLRETALIARGRVTLEPVANIRGTYVLRLAIKA